MLLLSLRYRLLIFSLSASPLTYTYTLSLHDALPISPDKLYRGDVRDALYRMAGDAREVRAGSASARARRSEEHTSELQSLRHLVCRLLLEKKNSINEVGTHMKDNVLFIYGLHKLTAA